MSLHKSSQMIMLLLLLILLTVPILAQENTENPEPFTPEDNECYEGGTMEGRCNTDIDGDGLISQAEVDWAWTCGWYMARFNDGSFGRGDVPLQCSVLLPVEISEEEQYVFPRTDCSFVSGVIYCFDGNVMGQDADLDGKFELFIYIISDSTVGDGGHCPAGKPWGGDVDAYNPVVLAWLLGRGYKTTDDLCY